MSTRKVKIDDDYTRRERIDNRRSKRRDEAYDKAKKEWDKVRGADENMDMQAYMENYATKMGTMGWDGTFDPERREEDGENRKAIRAKGKKSRKDIRKQIERIATLAFAKSMEEEENETFPQVVSSQHLERAAKIAQKALVGG